MPKVWERGKVPLFVAPIVKDGLDSLLTGLPLELEWTSLHDATWGSVATEEIKKKTLSQLKKIDFIFRAVLGSQQIKWKVQKIPTPPHSHPPASSSMDIPSFIYRGNFFHVLFPPQVLNLGCRLKQYCSLGAEALMHT